MQMCVNEFVLWIDDLARQCRYDDFMNSTAHTHTIQGCSCCGAAGGSSEDLCVCLCVCWGRKGCFGYMFDMRVSLIVYLNVALFLANKPAPRMKCKADI